MTEKSNTSVAAFTSASSRSARQDRFAPLPRTAEDILAELLDHTVGHQIRYGTTIFSLTGEGAVKATMLQMTGSTSIFGHTREMDWADPHLIEKLERVLAETHDTIARANVDRYLIVFVEIRCDRSSTPSVTLHGETVYFGGLTENFEAAERIAREIVRERQSPRRTILPRVIEWPAGMALYDALCEAQERFEKLIADMNEADRAAF